MFKSLRWRLAVLFVSLAALVYFFFTFLGLGIFHLGLTNALDDEIQELASDIIPSISIENRIPSLKSWAYGIELEPTKLSTTIQLYAPDGRLLEEYGPKGIVGLTKHKTEKRKGRYSLRIISIPVANNGGVVGYLQLEHPTDARERSIHQFGLAMILAAPLLLIGLGICGYFFSKRAVAPVEETLGILRSFMADAGHELATPISIIQVNAEAMEDELGQDTAHLSRIGVITRATAHMSTLIQDLMLLAKMESPQLVAHTQPILLDKLVSATVDDFVQLAQQKKITLAIEECQPACILGDANSIKRMLSNLLANALRYTDCGGSVTVFLESTAHQARLSVKDTGIGIPKDCLEHIFERFYRVEKSRSRAQGGSGLGLSIVKAIVEAHQGKVAVESIFGKGSTFSIILPLKS